MIGINMSNVINAGHLGTEIFGSEYRKKSLKIQCDLISIHSVSVVYSVYNVIWHVYHNDI